MTTINQLPPATSPQPTDLIPVQTADGTTAAYTPANVAAAMGIGKAAYLSAGGANGAVVADVFGNLSPQAFVSQGTTAARTFAVRGADYVNIKDYGAVLDGAIDDTAALAAAYAAVPANGILDIPGGGFKISGWPNMTGQKLWRIDGNTWDNVASDPVFTIGGDDTAETVLSGGRAWARVATMTGTNGPLRSDFTLNAPNPAGVYCNLSLNGYVSQIPKGSEGIYGLWNLGSILTITGQSQGGTNAQHVGVSSTVNITSEQMTNPWVQWGNSWQFLGMTGDTTGYANGMVGIEMDMSGSGAEPLDTAFMPRLGSRVMAHFIPSSYMPNNWSANTRVAYNSVIQGTINGVAYTFICKQAGTTGDSQPSWDFAGNIDGTVIWGLGTTVAAQYSRIIDIDGTGGGSSTGTVLYVDMNCYDSILELSFATLETYGGSKPAAIRLGAGMPVDWSSDKTLAGQNKRTTLWNPATGNFEYQVGGAAVFSIEDNGSVALPAGAAITVGGASVVTSVNGDMGAVTIAPGGTFSGFFWSGSAKDGATINVESAVGLGGLFQFSGANQTALLWNSSSDNAAPVWFVGQRETDNGCIIQAPDGGSIGMPLGPVSSIPAPTIGQLLVLMPNGNGTWIPIFGSYLQDHYGGKNISYLRTGLYTVNTLPIGAPISSKVFVSDALNPAPLQPVVGGGSVTCPAFFNGTTWIVG